MPESDGDQMAECEMIHHSLQRAEYDWLRYCKFQYICTSASKRYLREAHEEVVSHCTHNKFLAGTLYVWILLANELHLS